MAYSYVLAHDLAGADTLKRLLVETDGWLESDHLPAGWLFKEFQQPGLEGGRVRVVHGYQFITRHGDHLTGHNKALAELREKEEYDQQDLDRFAKLLPERQAVHRTWEQDWAEVTKTLCTSVLYLVAQDATVPAGWKTRHAAPGGKKLFLAVDGSQFQNRRIALQQMLTEDYPDQDIETMRVGFLEEGWIKVGNAICKQDYFHRLQLFHRTTTCHLAGCSG